MKCVPETKKCKICKINKDKKEFARHVNGDLRPLCLICWDKFGPIDQKERYKLSLERRRKRDRERARENIRKVMLKGAKYRAKKYNVPFNIDLEDIIVPEICPVLGVKIQQAEGKNSDNSPSLDKLIPEKGYTKGNVFVISWRANSIKRDMSVDELKKVISYIEKYSNQNQSTINI